jgi:L-lactate utilization protein LutC
VSTTSPASPDLVAQTIAAVEARGMVVTRVNDAAAALAAVQALIPDGASVMTASSVTLQQIGFEDLLKVGTHRWHNLKAEVLAAPDMPTQAQRRRQATLADYWVGSVQAIAATGEVVVASASGSQLPAYAFSSPNLIWVVGTQKLVPTLSDAIARAREEAWRHEDARQKQLGNPGSFVGKLLIIEREAPYLRRALHLILVDEPLGY